MDIIGILFFSLGLFMSITQGFMMLVGTLSHGAPLGVDVLMPVDIPIYLILFLVKDKSKTTRFKNTVTTGKVLGVLFFLLSISGVFFAEEPTYVRFQIVLLGRAILVFYCLASRLHDKKSLEKFVIGLLFGFGFQCLIGFYQWRVGPISIPYLVTPSKNVSGTFNGVRNAFALYLITILPLVIRVAFFTKLRFKWAWYGITVMGLGCLFATFTRGAWLGFVFSMALFFSKDLFASRMPIRQKIYFVSVTILVILVMTFRYGGHITQRMSDSSETLKGDKKESRINLAKDAIRVFKLHPLLGVGMENYRYHSDKSIPGLRIVHNAYLLIAAEQGVFSIVIFLILHGLVFFRGLALLKAKDTFIYQVGSATLTSFVSVMIYHMIAPDYRLNGVITHHWRIPGMILGLLVCMALSEKVSKRKTAKLAGKKAPVLPPDSDTSSSSENNTTHNNFGTW